MGVGNCCWCLISSAVIVAIAIALGIYFGVINEEDFTTLTGIDTPSLPPAFFNDPKEGIPQGEYPTWETSGSGGLQLEVVFKADSSWEERFDEAMGDWENGDPDALSLSIRKEGRDAACDYEDGVMVVCNNDFGDNGWKGINEFETQGGFILKSRAMMNDYYLTGASYEEREFTMCHELGHGFGLAHTDEIFTNANLGNCMDYTNRYESNMRPSTDNFQTLADSYGTVARRRRSLATNSERNITRMPDWMLEQYEYSLHRLLLHHRDDEHAVAREGWRVLLKTDFAAIYDLDLGDGHGARVNMLLA